MLESLTISALAKRAGVSSKALRYWEGQGLLPRAARSHTGYRLFDSESLHYVAFIRKSKAIGLTLAEMRQVLEMARRGRCPCRQVIEWTERRVEALELENQRLSEMLRRLKRIRRQWSEEPCPDDPCGVVCSLIEELPEAKSFQGGKTNAKTLAGRFNRPHGSGSQRVACAGEHAR
jgi:MerR family transcriptional regulator, copper efflux regulator